MSLYVLIITALLILMLGYLIFRIVLRAQYRQFGQLLPMGTALEIIVLFLHGASSSLFMPAGWPPLKAAHVWIGTVLFVVGLAGVLVAMTRLGWKRSVGQETRQLHREGLYRISRNPQIVAYGMVVLGYALLWPTWISLIWWGIYWVLAHWMVRTEEEHLLNIYGEAYQAYCQQVPRYLFI